MANTLAYYDTAKITVVISFIVHAPGVIIMKRFSSLSLWQNKLECFSLASLELSLTIGIKNGAPRLNPIKLFFGEIYGKNIKVISAKIVTFTLTLV
jgi:hypothetical protein